MASFSAYKLAGHRIALDVLPTQRACVRVIRMVQGYIVVQQNKPAIDRTIAAQDF